VVGEPPLANTLDQLRSLAKGDIDGITSMSATVDGRPVRGLSGPDTPYRAVPTKPFF
jgi:hypothetical protein